MEFRIANTFTNSLERLSDDEQKSVKTTAFDLQMSPANPGMKFHRLDNIRDKRFWSVRVTGDLRLIVHRSDNGLLLCYVDHHDRAYQWARRRKLENHPVTGAAQFVEIREIVQEVIRPQYTSANLDQTPKPLIFADLNDDLLLSYGVPSEWIDIVRAADEDSILDLSDHLPAEAFEALLEIAIGGTPEVFQIFGAETNPFEHPDARRRFQQIFSFGELERAMEYPWDQWAVFLHPAQRQMVEGDYRGPVRISGSAGTGKTIVALHRAVYLARSNPEARVLLTTFSDTLANALKQRLIILVGNEPGLAERLDVYSINELGRRLYELNVRPCIIADREYIRQALEKAVLDTGIVNFNPKFLMNEWESVVDAWQLRTFDDYSGVPRIGKKRRLNEKQRALIWSLFEKVWADLEFKGLLTWATVFNQLAQLLSDRESPLFDYAVIDEAQDIGVSQLRFLAALGGNRPNSLFFAGDLGQRVFQAPYSWKSLGVDIRGRSKTLKINYRTSHQIRRQADRLLAPEISDVDGNTEGRFGTVSVFSGPEPIIRVFDNTELEGAAVGQWIKDLANEGIQSQEIGLFVRSNREIVRAIKSVEEAALQYCLLDEKVSITRGKISIGTMHLAKGLEFRAVAVAGCDDEILPMQARIELAADDTDLEEIYNTELNLLYVACTRAREHLWISGVEPASEFLDDLISHDEI